MDDADICCMDDCWRPVYAFCATCGDPVCLDHTRLVDSGRADGLESAYCPPCDEGDDGESLD